ncbi:MAG: FmdB family zinc ribbon protein [Candidatus Thorarchaeota archaeon]
MPRYEYLCDCGEVMEDFSSIADRKSEIKCDACGKMAPRHFGNSLVGQKDNPRTSMAMAVHPSQIEAAMKKWPGSRYNSKGHLLIANRTEKKARMKQRGYTEY